MYPNGSSCQECVKNLVVISLVGLLVFSVTDTFFFPKMTTRFCYNSPDPTRVNSQCVLCKYFLFDSTLLGCTGMSALSVNITAQQAFCIISNCLGQVRQAPVFLGRKRRSTEEIQVRSEDGIPEYREKELERNNNGENSVTQGEKSGGSSTESMARISFTLNGENIEYTIAKEVEALIVDLPEVYEQEAIGGHLRTVHFGKEIRKNPVKTYGDDFIVGDRVWVNGVKPGYIQYLGETHFGDGDWAGVVLDEPVGKNDGSVRGKRYFYCEPKRGIFCRLHRLTRYPDLAATATDLNESSSRCGSSLRNTPSPCSGSLSRVPLRSSLTSRRDTKLPRSPLHDDDWIVGDRVWVNGTKPGYIQFLGETHFGEGDWAGVVLDDPIGKNDGSVRGKRYFYCEPKRGVFCRLNRLKRYPDIVQRSPSPSRVYTSSITVQRASTPTKKYTSSITIQRSPSPSRVCTLHHFSRHSTGTLTM